MLLRRLPAAAPRAPMPAAAHVLLRATRGESAGSAALQPALLRWGRGLSSSSTSAADGQQPPPSEEAAEAPPADDEPPTAEIVDEAAAPEEASLQERIAELEEEVKAKHDQVLRALAEAENARRRAALDVEGAHKFAVGKFAKSLLDVADNLSRAAEAVPEEVRASDEQPTLKALYEGVVMTEAVLVKTFEQHGLVKIWPMDEKFDPNIHDALFEMPDPNREPGTVAHVASAGYLLHDRCIRPAGVGVVKA